jgi:adenine phosphoribosyltransferase
MIANQVRRFRGESSFRVKLNGLERDVPLVEVSPNLWIASDAELILGDVGFLSTAARLLAERLKNEGFDVIVTAEAKSIALAYALSNELGHGRFVVARKNLKAYMGEHISQTVRSITTSSEQSLILTSQDASWIKERRACLFDDVVSTGATLRALDDLVRKAGGTVACSAALWKEGPWYQDERLVYVGSLPVFVNEKNPLWSEAR